MFKVMFELQKLEFSSCNLSSVMHYFLKVIYPALCTTRAEKMSKNPNSVMISSPSWTVFDLNDSCGGIRLCELYPHISKCMSDVLKSEMFDVFSELRGWEVKWRTSKHAWPRNRVVGLFGLFGAGIKACRVERVGVCAHRSAAYKHRDELVTRRRSGHRPAETEQVPVS